MKCPQCEHENEAAARFCPRCGAGLEIHIDEDRSAYTTPVAPGTIFEGKYQVLEEIGRGGMGVVYRGHDLSLGRMVAIKVLPEQFNTDDEVIARFKKEARAMAALDHPNIVPVYAIGQQRNYHYFVMKFLEGQTVAEALDELRKQPDGRFTPQQVVHIIGEVCRGLGHAHRRGLIHRDIKPGNIMLSPDDTVTIMDFGIVKEQAGGENLTRTGLVFGTPEYMAPEQAQGQAVPGSTTDIYSLGVVAYEMLSGRPPYQGDTPFSVVLKHIKKPPPPLVDVLPDIGLELQQVVFRSLAKKPVDRYQTAEEFREALGTASRTPAPEPPAEVIDVPSLPNELPPEAPPMDIVVEPPPAGIPSPNSPSTTVTPRVDARPYIPVTRAQPQVPQEPAVVMDRPGHYRQLITAQDRRQQERSRRRTMLLVVAALVIGAIGVGLIVFSATRKSSRAPARVEADAGVEGAAAQPEEPPREADAEMVAITLITEPAGARVFELRGDAREELGVTTATLRRSKGSRASLVLELKGYKPKEVVLGFGHDRTERWQLTRVQ